MTRRGKNLWFGVIGAVIGISVTLWYWSEASRHIVPSEPWVSPDEAFTREDRLDIMEVVFRHVSGAASAATWFVAVGSDDPPLELLQRFRDLSSPVKPSSSGERRGSALVDPASGKEGFVVNFRRARMIAVDEALVEVAVQSGEASDATKSFNVRQEGGKWKVTKEGPS